MSKSQQPKLVRDSKGRMGRWVTIRGHKVFIPQKKGSVRVRAGKGATPADVKYVAGTMEKLAEEIPPSHLEGFGITVIGRSKWAKAGKVTRPSSAITIPRRTADNKRISSKDMKRTIAHEIGHQVWHRQLTEPQRAAWRKRAKRMSLAFMEGGKGSRIFPYLETVRSRVVAGRMGRKTPKEAAEIFAHETFAEVYGAVYGGAAWRAKQFPRAHELFQSLL